MRQHAEHIAERDGVTVVPHYEREPMYTLVQDGALRTLLTQRLQPGVHS